MSSASLAIDLARGSRWIWAVAVLVALAVFGVSAASPGHRAVPYLLVHGALLAAMLTAWRTRARVADVLWAGLLIRLALVPVPSFSTHDVDRYLWDGRVALEGLDPYRLAPDHPALAALRAVWPTPAEHAHVPTLYPPGALALFAACASLGHATGFLAWKAIVALASAATLVLARRVLSHRGLGERLSLVALSPLLVLEGGVGAHVDLVAAAGLLAAIDAVDRGRPGLAGAALGGALLIKLLPAAAALPLALMLPRRQALRLIAALLTVALSGYLAAYALGAHPVGSLPTFLERWRFGAIFPYSADDPSPLRTVFFTMGVAGIVLLVAVVRWRGSPRTLPLAMGLPLLASPVVFPWYLAPLAAVTPLAPSAIWIGWQAVAPLSYEVLDLWDLAGRWEPAGWPVWAVRVALLVGLVAGLVFMRGLTLRERPAARRGAIQGRP